MPEESETGEVSAAEIANAVADVLDGAVLLLKDVNVPCSPDKRLFACIAALEHAREQLEPLVG